MYNSPHPGEILCEYIYGIGKTVTEVACGPDTSRKHLSLILNGQWDRSVSTDFGS